MDINDYYDMLDELDDNEQINRLFDNDKRRPRVTGRHPKQASDSDLEFIKKQDDSRGNFKFTYKAARFEEWWLLKSLGGFYEHKWISDVLRKIKGGKEASVYQCSPGVAVDAKMLAVKVYRPRILRNLKNDHQYRVGRADLDEDGNVLWKEADLNAIEKRTSYGEEVRHRSWIAYELKTMETLFAAGADVPKPFAMENNSILMEFIGEGVTHAPTLSSVNLEIDEANSLFERTILNIDIMLSSECIHGDLSAYNILYWGGEIKIIDFPQIVIPRANPTSWKIFQRDVIRVCQYFSSQGVKCDPSKLALELWTSHGYKAFKPVDPIYLDPEIPNDRKIWEDQK